MFVYYAKVGKSTVVLIASCQCLCFYSVIQFMEKITRHFHHNMMWYFAMCKFGNWSYSLMRVVDKAL